MARGYTFVFLCFVFFFNAPLIYTVGARQTCPVSDQFVAKFDQASPRLIQTALFSFEKEPQVHNVYAPCPTSTGRIVGGVCYCGT